MTSSRIVIKTPAQCLFNNDVTIDWHADNDYLGGRRFDGHFKMLAQIENIFDVSIPAIDAQRATRAAIDISIAGKAATIGRWY